MSGIRRDPRAQVVARRRYPVPVLAGAWRVQIRPVAPERTGETPAVRARRPGRHRARRVRRMDIQAG